MKQHEQILDYIEKNHRITPMDAYECLGITKLATRISELRKLGWEIPDKWEHGIRPDGTVTKWKCYTGARWTGCER